MTCTKQLGQVEVLGGEHSGVEDETMERAGEGGKNIVVQLVMIKIFSALHFRRMGRRGCTRRTEQVLNWSFRTRKRSRLLWVIVMGWAGGAFG